MRAQTERDRARRRRAVRDRCARRSDRSTAISPNCVRTVGKTDRAGRQQGRGPAGEAGRLEAYALGLGDPVAISAEHGEGLADLYDALAARIARNAAASADRATAEDGPAPIGDRVAIVGRPNVGKSTLVNRHDRRGAAAHRRPRPVSPRDAIAVDWTGADSRSALRHRRARAARRASRRSSRSSSVADALRAVRFAEVVVLVDRRRAAVREAGSADRRPRRAARAAPSSSRSTNGT